MKKIMSYLYQGYMKVNIFMDSKIHAILPEASDINLHIFINNWCNLVPAPTASLPRAGHVQTRHNKSAFIHGSFFVEAPAHHRCANLLYAHIPKFVVFATFAFSAMRRLTPQCTPGEQNIHRLNKATEMTKMTTPPASGRIKVHPLITIFHPHCEYFHIPLQEYNNKLT